MPQNFRAMAASLRAMAASLRDPAFVIRCGELRFLSPTGSVVRTVKRAAKFATRREAERGLKRLAPWLEDACVDTVDNDA